MSELTANNISGIVWRQVDETTVCFCSRSVWLRCYLVLSNSCLLIHDSAESVSPLLTVSLYGAACVLIQTPKTDKKFSLEIVTPTQNIIIATDNTQDMKNWAISIQKAALNAIAPGGDKPVQKQIIPAGSATPAESGN